MPTLSDSDKEQLLNEGYVRLPDAVPPALLSKWQQIAEQLEQRALANHAKGEQTPGACVVEDAGGPRVMRQDDIFLSETEPTLALLASPAMMAVSRELCGRGSTPVQMDILYKHQHPHPVINWHQGAPHPRGYPYLNVGIYLDDAPEGDGCLRYVPETQHSLVDIQNLSAEHGWEIPGVVELPAKAGDILVQDMMVLHGSQPKRSPGVRRTIYVELRPADGVRESERYSDEWIALRNEWMSQVIQRADPTDWPADWRSDHPESSTTPEDLAQRIANAQEPAIPAVWATFPVDHPDYPVPADMRE